jgi:hypothetical protein
MGLAGWNLEMYPQGDLATYDSRSWQIKRTQCPMGIRCAALPVTTPALLPSSVYPVVPFYLSLMIPSLVSGPGGRVQYGEAQKEER